MVIERPLVLGLRANWQQFTLLVVVNALVGAMIGQERAILPILAEQEQVIERAQSLVFVAPRKGPSSMPLGLAVQAVAREKGIVFEEYHFPGLETVDGIAIIEGQERAAWFKDSEGNILALGEPLP